MEGRIREQAGLRIWKIKQRAELESQLEGKAKLETCCSDASCSCAGVYMWEADPSQSLWRQGVRRGLGPGEGFSHSGSVWATNCSDYYLRPV